MPDSIIEITEIINSILPIILGVTLLLFTLARRILESRIDDKYEITKLNDSGEAFPKLVEKLLLDETTNLQLLEELYKAERSGSIYFNNDNRRARDLKKIQSSLRKAIKNNIDSEKFSEIRDRSMALISDAKQEISSIQELKPFDGLGEPEKSLLIDLLEEIPNEKQIPKQKASQLADIIKIKHQDMLKLQQENAKSAAWTRWGTAGTIFFGVLSIILSIYATN